MDFEFSSEQELLRASVRRFLAERAPIGYVREQLDDPVGTTAATWSGLADLGVIGLLVPEEYGGAGMGMVDMAVVLEELGRAVHPGPFTSTAVAAVSTVARAGSTADHATLLPELASGDTIGTLGLTEPGGRPWEEPATSASELGGTWTLSGTKVHVADAEGAQLLFVTARAGAELGVFAVRRDAGGLEVAPTPTVDGTRKEGTVTLADTPAIRVGSGDAAEAVAEIVDRLAVAAVVDGVGAASRALEMAVDYAKERQQFGRPIGSFQAVQHLCADMLQTVELGRAGAYYACWAADGAEPAERHRAATMAKAFATDGFYRVGASAIQVFGGVGFTWEHDIHLYYKRLLTLQQAGGGAIEHLEELASIILD